jgi:hypothetical protein
MSETLPISIREYSRRRGVSDTAVRKAIASGKISRGVIDQDTKRPKILPGIADMEWESYTNPNYERVRKSERLARSGPIRPPAAPTPPADAPAPDISGKKPLAEIKRLTAEVGLNLAAIELRKKKGELIDRKSVYSALFEAGQEVKNAVLGVPDRYIDAILAAPGRNEAWAVLNEALIEALQTVADIDKRELN